MKRILSIAIATAIAGGAYAQTKLSTPEAYTYKATVKNVNLKRVNIRLTGTTAAQSVFIKFVETSNLYGYLINACDDCGTGAEDGKGYLVVANRKYNIPYILPADLKVKWWNPKINATRMFETEGYLFAGNGKKSAPFTPLYQFGDQFDIAGASTRFLFGMYNDYVYDAQGVPVTFFDAWLDASGFGKAITDSKDGGCGIGSTCTQLDTLCGSVIGGLYLCHPNGYPLDRHYEGFLCLEWVGTTDVITGSWCIKRTTLAGSAPFAQNTLGNLTIDALVNAASRSIKAGYNFDDTSVAPAKQNGLVNALFAARYAY